MMKKYSLKTILLIFVILFIFGCGNRIKGPAIRFDTISQNFGEVDEGKEVPFTFTFTNPGSEKLIISNVHPTCGCTLAGEYDKEVEPGKKGSIPFVLNTKGFQLLW